MINKFKKDVESTLSELVATSFGVDKPNLSLSFPPDLHLGDFAFECFSLSQQLKLSPALIATKLAASFVKDDLIESVSASGPYLNIKIKNAQLFSIITKEVLNKGSKFGDHSSNSKETIMVEYLCPNTNKPLHVGHLRNGALGMAVSNILAVSGAKVIKANLINDRGVHICKSMLAWQRWGNESTPESMKMKGDHFVGYWYVRFAQEAKADPTLEDQAQEMLQQWEKGDEDVLALWRKMNGWVLAGLEDSCKNLNFLFDKVYYESKTYKLGKQLVMEGLEKGIFQRDKNGSIIATLPADKFGLEKDGSEKKSTLIRSDGTSLYITQDLETAKLKFDENGLTQSIYVVGSEQEHHFKILFNLLERLNFDWAKKCFHLSYAMVYLPEGKMKSREGKVVDADELLAEMHVLAMEEMKKRDSNDEVSDIELNKRAHVVADAAIKYFLLQFNPKQDIHFDPKASLAFEGNTGPYCLYTYARAKSILTKIKNVSDGEIDFSLLGEYEEIVLVNSIINFNDLLQKAVIEMNPARVVLGLYEVAKAFNQFYHAQPVLSIDDQNKKNARLALVEAVSIVIKKGLNLLNIEVIEKM
ncbi:MAG: arginine--tRNA ligase [Candidatus Berkelbacteria bacterium]